MTTRERFVVGVDGGSQSTKVVIFDQRGNAVAEGREPLRPASRPRPGVVEHPDDDLWDSLAAASRHALAGFRGDPRDIVAVGLCTIRCCKAFLRADGSLARPVMSWMDTRAYQPWMPDDPGVAWATTSSGYLAHRLTGEFRDTAANSIRLQWPIATDRWQWSEDEDLLRQFRLRRDQLFELVPPGSVAGRVTAAAAEATGLPAGMPVVVTANDKAVEALGSGSLDTHTALVSLGTYIAAMVHGERNREDARAFWTNFGCIPHRYLYESHGIRRGMWTLTWFMDLLGPEFAAAAAAQGVTREEVLEREARAVPAGSEGLITVLDWLAPTDKPFRKGVMIGFDARHTRAHCYRSILEAIALTMKGHVDAMTGELGIALREVVLSGGGAGSALCMQLFADVFGIPASRARGPAGASLGAAVCAAVAAGLYPGFEAAVAGMERPRETFTPGAANAAIYGRLERELFRGIRDSTDQVLQRSWPIFQ
jgi:sugar (pentulose or hexulose) kinase